MCRFKVYVACPDSLGPVPFWVPSRGLHVGDHRTTSSLEMVGETGERSIWEAWSPHPIRGTGCGTHGSPGSLAAWCPRSQASAAPALSIASLIAKREARLDRTDHESELSVEWCHGGKQNGRGGCQLLLDKWLSAHPRGCSDCTGPVPCPDSKARVSWEARPVSPQEEMNAVCRPGRGLGRPERPNLLRPRRRGAGPARLISEWGPRHPPRSLRCCLPAGGSFCLLVPKAPSLMLPPWSTAMEREEG